MTESDNTEETRKKMLKNKFNLKKLRKSLKYRPEIMKLILKMRHHIRKKRCLIMKLKHQLKAMEKLWTINKDACMETVDGDIKNYNEKKPNKNNRYSQTEGLSSNDICTVDDNKELIKTETKCNTKDESSQTDAPFITDTNKDVELKTKLNDQEKMAWNVGTENGENEKSIADQVKEVAQSAMQQSGMVYVESAGMYYDYKTGYYYNPELGLYYHTETGCYYYYSEEKQTFVFHSYPDRDVLNENISLQTHQKRKAKKHKKMKQTEDDIDNLTKNFSQDKNEDTNAEASKPKRRKKSSKKDEKNNEKSSNKSVDHNSLTLKSDKDVKEKDKSKNGDVENTDTDAKVKEVTKESTLNDPELEDGECSETESEKSKEDESDASTSTASDDESVAKHHPPSMRVIVRETNLPKLKIGTLFLVTKDGGTVGREGDQHAILIRDHNVSRNHLDIKYNNDKQVYTVTDLGSKNGTILNGYRMSESQAVSKPMEVIHGSTLQLGETKLLCHIHPGNDTCGHCEPGLIMEFQEKEKKVAYTRTCSVQKQHQLELARLKNKYARRPLSIEETAYNDRAQARRDAVGSSHHAEKTQTADMDTFIAPENKGFKLLEKMGWSKGEGLGKDNQGDTEPIPLVSNDGKSGLGTPGSVAPPAAPSMLPTVRTNTLGPPTLRLASKTKMLRPPAKAFQNNLDEDSE